MKIGTHIGRWLQFLSSDDLLLQRLLLLRVRLRALRVWQLLLRVRLGLLRREGLLHRQRLVRLRLHHLIIKFKLVILLHINSMGYLLILTYLTLTVNPQ